MTDSEALLKERDRLAHEVAKAAIELREIPHSFHTADGYGQVAANRVANLNHAVEAYEQADRRAQAEATA